MALFLEDKPAEIENNKFDAHRLISDAIVNDIQSGSRSSRRIAIIGDWGSGKSTIVNYIEQSLANEKDTVFVNFDLWSHTGDALRRSFLHNVYKAINGKVDIDELAEQKKESWQGVKQKIEYEQQAVLTLERQDLSPIVIFAALLAVLYGALGIACAAIRPLLPSEWASFLPLGQLAIALFVCGVIRLASKTPIFRSTKDNLSIVSRLKMGVAEVVKNLGGKPDVKRTTTTQTELLGTIAFEDYLDEMLQTAKEIVPNVKLIVVFDNLDRLKEGKIEEAWNGIQIFSNYLNCSDNPVESWLILPISDKTISAISSRSQNPDGAISKLFIVRYVIPQPILSDWKTLVFTYLEKAFPGIKADEKLYAFECVSISDIAAKRTPRSCISFINDMVAESKMFPDIGLLDIAAFVLLRRTHKSDSSTFESQMTIWLADDDYVSQLPGSLTDQISPDALAMMTYGVDDPEKAQELFLKALFASPEDIDSLQLDVVSEKNKGIWNGIREYILQEFSETGISDEHARVDALITKLAEYKPVDEENRSERTETLISCIPMIQGSRWTFKKTMGSSIIEILKASSYSHNAITQVNASISRTSQMLHDDYEANRTWLQESETVLRDLHEHEKSLDYVGVALQGSPYAFFEIVSELDMQPNIFGQFEFLNEDIQKITIEELIENQPTTSDSGVGVLKMIGSSRIFTSTSSPDIETLITDMRLSQSDRTKLFFSFWWIANQVECAPVKRFLGNIIKNQGLESYFYDSQTSAYELAASIGYFIANDFHSESKPHHDTFFTRQHTNINEETVRAYLFGTGEKLQQNRVHDVFSGLDSQDGLRLHMAELAIFNLGAHVPFSHVVTLYKAIDAANQNKLEDILLKDYTTLEVSEAPFTISLSEFYAKLKKLTSNQDFNKWLEQEINSLDSDFWSNQLRLSQPSKQIALAKDIFEGKDLPEDLNNAVADLLKDYSLKDALGLLEVHGLISTVSSAAFSEYSSLLAAEFRDGNGRTWITCEPLNERMWINDMSPEDAFSTYSEVLKINTNAGAQCLAIQSRGLVSLDKQSLSEIMSVIKAEIAKTKDRPKGVIPDLKAALDSLIKLDQ